MFVLSQPVSDMVRILQLIFIIVCTIIITVNLILLDYRNRFTDRMTGISNDAGIFRRGGMMYFRNRLNGYDCLFVNIKNCKYINQKVSNVNGDRIIAEFAGRMTAHLRKKGIIGRMGGDNFLVFIKDEYLNGFLDFIASQPFETDYNGKTEHLTVSARAGIYKIHDTDAKKEGRNGYHELVNRAAFALRRAKEENLDHYIFEDEMMKKLIRETETLQALRNAMTCKAFVVYYQPKVETRTGRLCGAEGLVRWNRNGEIVMPGDFIPLLEKNGEISGLDFLVFELACADIREWIDKGLEPVRISTNFSRLHLDETDFTERIIEIMNRYGIDSKYVEAEFTESQEGKNLAALHTISRQLKKNNIKIAIDDFGTGYSSLSLIKNYDADIIKLDKTFIDSAKKDDTVSRNFVRNIIHMVEGLGEQTLCEGVEEKEQLDFLIDAGCNTIQGYYFDKPMPKEEFEKRLRKPVYTI